MDLTNEQLDLMFIHYLIDTDRLDAEDTTPSQDSESYHDPDFMDEWNEMSSEGCKEMDANSVPQIFDESEEVLIPEKCRGISDWEEV